MDPDLAFALRLADLADSISLPKFDGRDFVVETKPDLTPVTDVDRSVERALRQRIEAGRPGDAVVGEEYGGDEAEAGAVRWIIDPIDGTKNFVRGIPVWATLVAGERDGRVDVGVASAPALGRRWWASRGAGAFAGRVGAGSAEGRRIEVSRIATLEEAQILVGGLKGWKRAGMLDGVLHLLTRAWRGRGFGDFWMHMLVAEGAAEVAAEPEVSLWDLAAVSLIVEEAGGRFTDLTGRPTPSGGSALSSNGLLHDRALHLLVGE